METRTYKVYKFHELPKEAQKKAINNYHYFNVDDPYWYYIELLDSDIFSNDMEKYFDLERRGYIQFPKLEVKDYEKFWQLLKIPKALGVNISFRFESTGENNTEFTFTQFDDEKYDTPKNNLLIEKAVKIFDQLMLKALKDLRSQYDYLTSDEAIIETFEANDYDFTIDGKID